MVDHVVERHREGMDVGDVHVHSPASLREPAQDLVGDPVALVLARAYLFAELARLGEHAEELPQQATRDVGVPAGLVEQGQQEGIWPTTEPHALDPSAGHARRGIRTTGGRIVWTSVCWRAR